MNWRRSMLFAFWVVGEQWLTLFGYFTGTLAQSALDAVEVPSQSGLAYP